MRLFVVVVAASAVLSAQDAAPLAPEILQLAKIRERTLLNLAHQPNYTCVETVERSHRGAPSRRFQLLDTIRIEVALVDGKEMFGWPGSKKFEDVELRDIVTTGAFGNGNFALHARAIFGNTASQFDYRGADTAGVRYDFRVPLFASGYKIRVQAREAIVAYRGTVWVDPDSLDLRRIEVIADEIPMTLGLSQATDQMNYARMRIGDSDFLLPASSELTMTDLDGSESRNHVRFTSCRQFSGESVLTFGDAPEPEETLAPVAEIVLPRDLGMRLTLLDDIDMKNAAVGDPIRARLENDLRSKGKTLFAKGATVIGRITRMDRHEGYTDLGLELSEIESPGLRARLKAKLDEVVGVEPFGLRLRRGIPPPVAKPGEGLIPMNSSRHKIAHGILMLWRT